MDVKQALLDAGFDRVIALNGEPYDGGTLLLAFCTYEAEAVPGHEGAWVHPYYYASQKAYMAASAVVKRAQEAGVGVALRDEIRVKPIFARLPGFTQGRNTLSYMEGVGSRFHVQILLLDEVLQPDLHPEAEPHPLHCGECRACLTACPTGALDEAGFHRERCIRNWMMSGQPIPEELRPFMGNRLMGCDECQRCCPRNPQPTGEALPTVNLHGLLTDARTACAGLKQSMGANMAIPNRVLSQACLIAGCSGDAALLPVLEELMKRPSPAVAAHAAWAAEKLAADANHPCTMDENTL